jgi:hypothetical protein
VRGFSAKVGPAKRTLSLDTLMVVFKRCFQKEYYEYELPRSFSTKQLVGCELNLVGR